MRPITRKRLSKVWLGLQSMRSHIPRSQWNRLHAAMDVLDDINHEMRRKAIFDAGAKARKPTPRFERGPLGSMESMTFYDGYASTHPKFQNPYRSR
jgi:hypothetical protein